MLFTKLGWFPIDDIICTRKLISPLIFPITLTMSRMAMITTQEPQEEYLIMHKCKKHSGLRTFHSSATCLWNKTEPSLRDTLPQKGFLGDQYIGKLDD